MAEMKRLIDKIGDFLKERDKQTNFGTCLKCK